MVLFALSPSMVLLLLLSTTPCWSQNYFINPPPAGSNAPAFSWVQGTNVTITWASNYANIALSIWQVDGSLSHETIVYPTANTNFSGSLPSNILGSQGSDIFYLEIANADATSQTFDSEQFTIFASSSTSSATTTSSSSSSLSSSSTITSTSSTTSTTSTTSTASRTSTTSPSTSTSTSAVGTSTPADTGTTSISSNSGLGLAVGLGIGIPLILIAAAVAIWMWRRSQRQKMRQLTFPEFQANDPRFPPDGNAMSQAAYGAPTYFDPKAFAEPRRDLPELGVTERVPELP